jgi:serine/threonine-protein kinase
VDAAAQVADGAPVDWADAEAHADRENRRLVRHLRLVESIASLHRSIAPSEGDDFLPRAQAGADRALPGGAAGPHWGRLSMLDRIGQGTSCEVFRAWDTALHREVALKLLHGEDDDDRQDAHTRLLEEARRLARIRHPHVVQVYGAEEHDRRVGLWMELVRGESLEQLVQQRGPLGAREAALVGLDLCAALAAVHGAGLLHRDIKAQNVMREHGGRLVLMDFGTGEELAGTNRLIGTPLYLAPEIFRGQRASVQSDLYSLGVLLYYLVTGKFPVDAGSMEDLARAHARRERRPLRDLRPDLPEAYIATVERVLDGDPARRYHSVGELESALRESLDLPAPRAAARSISPIRRPRIGAAFAAAAAVLVAVIAALIVWTGRPAAGDPSIRSLAVLPLLDRSGTLAPDAGDAMTEQLIATLGQIQSLRTTTLRSTLPLKGSDRPRTEIGRQLGVDALLEGTVRSQREGAGTVALDVALISASGGATLWSGSFERPRGEAAALLADVAMKLAAAVNAPVTGSEAIRLGQARSTSPAAEEAYLQGRLHLASYGPEPARRALASFSRAIQIDPTYPAAHAASALAYLRLGGTNVVTHSEARLQALSEVRKAFESGSDIAEAHAALADIKFLYDWDWSGAELEYRRALAINPGFVPARNNYAQALASRRRFPDALAVSEETLRLDPQSTDALIAHGMLLYYKRDLAAATSVADRVVSAEPNNPAGYVLAGRVAEASGRYQDALILMRRASELAGDGGVNLQLLVVRLQALSGETADARAANDELERAASAGSIRLHPRDRALLALGFGRTSDALDAFALAFAERDPSLVWLGVDPRVDPLRAEPRFVSLLQSLGFR